MEETVDPLEHVNMDARYQEGAEPDPFTLTLIGHSHPSNTIALMNTLPPEIISLIFSSLRGILLAKDVRNFPPSALNVCQHRRDITIVGHLFYGQISISRLIGSRPRWKHISKDPDLAH